MKYIKKVLFLALYLTCTVAMGAGKLHIYTWAEYVPPDLIKKFEQQHQVEVTVTNYRSNEQMLVKLKTEKSDFDIIMPAHYMVVILIKEGLLEKTNAGQMTNIKNVLPKYANQYWDPKQEYSVPYAWGLAAILVDTNKYKGEIDSYKVFFDPPDELKGKISMLDDMNDVINAGLFYLGLPRCNQNPEDLKKLSDLLTQAKPYWRTYSSDPFSTITSGDIIVSHGWNGTSIRAQEVMPSVHFIYPKEGYSAFVDLVAVPKGAPNLENAKLFQNFIMDTKNAAMITDYSKFGNMIKGSEQYLEKELRNKPGLNPPDNGKGMEFIPPCDQDVVNFYTKIWTKLRS